MTYITNQVLEELREIIAHKLDDLILEVDHKRITRQRMDTLSYEYADKILNAFTTTLQPNPESLQPVTDQRQTSDNLPKIRHIKWITEYDKGDERKNVENAQHKINELVDTVNALVSLIKDNPRKD